MIIKTNKQLTMLLISSNKKSVLFVLLWWSYHFSVNCLSQDPDMFHPWQLIEDNELLQTNRGGGVGVDQHNGL